MRVLVASLAVASTLAVANWPVAPLPPGLTADLVVVDKTARTVELYQGSARLASYPASLGGAARDGHKQHEGDERTPEGRYVLDGRNAQSAYHRSLHISYPNADDEDRAQQAGRAPGGMIMIHGLPNGLGWLGRLQRLADWTDGCIAVTNAEMAQVWRAVPDGTPIEIHP